MSPQTLLDAAALVRAAHHLYADDTTTTEVLNELDRRLREPLRLAIAGIVKAGKSTLLNAMLGERIAPTDAGECTRVVTWYRYADTPSITVHPHEGPPMRRPVRRTDGQLVLDLGTLSAQDVARIDIGWPSRVLRSVVLIDTPGIASLSQEVSARSTAFLTPEESPSAADAIVYLLRHLRPSDLRFLEAFHGARPGDSRTVNAVAVLSRSDEIGTGRIDSLLSASKVARRYELDGSLASLALAVIPVAGLLAEGGRTLRESEFIAFRNLAGLERSDRERLLVSADRFVRPTDQVNLSTHVRRELLSRYGIFGVRLATSLIRAGAANSSELAESIVQQSGLDDLRRFIEVNFGARTAALKARGVLDSLERLLRESPRDGTDAILGGIERIQASSHGLKELTLLSQARLGGLPLSAEDAATAARVAGAGGTAPTARLGLPDDAEPAAILKQVAIELDTWRERAQAPRTGRAAAEACRVVIRSLEEVALRVAEATADGGSSTDVMLPGRPGDRAGEGADEQSEQHQAGLGQQ